MTNSQLYGLYQFAKPVYNYVKKQVKSWADDMVDYYWTKPMNYFDSLYEVDSEKEFKHRAFWDSYLPGHPYSTYDDLKKLKRYMTTYDYDWDDILYPSQISASKSYGSSGVQTLNYVSSNVNRLYRRFR